MIRPFQLAVASGLAGLALAGCAHVSERDVPVGHACLRGFSATLQPRIYHCTFQLQRNWGDNEVFDEPGNRAQEKIVSALMADDGGKCAVVQAREMSDPTALLEHDLAFRVVTVRCE